MIDEIDNKSDYSDMSQLTIDMGSEFGDVDPMQSLVTEVKHYILYVSR